MELAHELDGLPLALATAGAYLNQVTTTFSDYLRLYRESWHKLQKSSPQLHSYADRSLYQTWQVSYDQIARENVLSAKLLKLWAYFDRRDVWYDLLRSGRSSRDEDTRKHPWFQELTEDEITFDAAVRLLCNYGIVSANPPLHQQVGSIGYSMHNCVHSWTKSVLNDGIDASMAHLAMDCVLMKLVNKKEKGWWLVNQRLIPHFVRQKRLFTHRVKDSIRKKMELFYTGLSNVHTQQPKAAHNEVAPVDKSPNH